MKKLLALLLMLALLLSMVACTGETTSDVAKETASASQDAESVQEDTAEDEPAEEITEAPAEEEPAEETVEEPAAVEEPVKETQVVFEELVVVDNEECLIKITGIDADNIWGYTLNAELENKSPEKTYMFSLENAAINGVEVYPFFASEVAPGKKAIEEITFSNINLEDLSENGAVMCTDIELAFRVYDSNDWSADPVAKETAHVYPYGEENATVFEREAQPSDNIIIDNDAVTVIVTGYEEDDVLGYTVNLFLVNKTDTDVMFTTEEASINGYMAEPYYANSLAAGKCEFSSITWIATTLEDSGITEIEEIEFCFRAYNSNDWLADDYANEVVTLTP